MMVVGIPIDTAASVMLGWKLGHVACVTVGFVMTFCGNIPLIEIEIGK
jgi:hypothetical protein